MHYFEWSGGMGWGALWMTLWWVLPILGIVALVKWLSSRDTRMNRETPLDILKSRYARGEIDHAEYERMRQQLEK